MARKGIQTNTPSPAHLPESRRPNHSPEALVRGPNFNRNGKTKWRAQWSHQKLNLIPPQPLHTSCCTPIESRVAGARPGLWPQAPGTLLTGPPNKRARPEAICPRGNTLGLGRSWPNKWAKLTCLSQGAQTIRPEALVRGPKLTRNGITKWWALCRTLTS